MKTFIQRLEELKQSSSENIQNRMIFLLNPKDTKILEAIIAWTAIPKKDYSSILVSDDAPMEELWKIAEPDIFKFATALGCTIVQANSRLEQLKMLGIIYPDGTVVDLANSIVNIYIKTQVGELRSKSKKNEED